MLDTTVGLEITAGPVKPLGRKNYGSIGHLPGSRTGPADHYCEIGQAAIAITKARPTDRVIVSEKLDGSNVGIARIDDKVHALVRAGYPAETSPYRMHHHFARWLRARASTFKSLLADGERCVGEWLLQAHGTRYRITDPEQLFVPFDIIGPLGKKEWRRSHDDLHSRGLPWRPAWVLSDGPALSQAAAMSMLGDFGFHDALDAPEGAVWRVETKGKFNFIVKHVASGKIDGRFLPQITGGPEIWNFPPHDI